MITKNKTKGEKNSYLKLFLCACGWQLWQPWTKLVDSGPLFAQNLTKVETMCRIWNNVFPQNLPRLRRLQFWQPRPIFPLKMKKRVSCGVFFFKNRGFSLLRKVFPHFFSLAICCSFGNPEENFLPVSQNIIFNLKKMKISRNSF